MTDRLRVPWWFIALVAVAWAVMGCAHTTILARTANDPIAVPPGSVCNILEGGMVCQPPAPPATYTLAIALSGGGTATTSVSPPGPQVSGTVRTLSVTPTGGSQRGAWSAGCADSMPQPAADTTCTRTVTPPVTPPSGGIGTWSLVSVGATGRYNWYYNLGAACPSGEFWMAWSGVTSRYNPVTNTWSTDTTTNSMGWRENFATWCDATNVVHLTAGTSGPPEWSGFVTYGMGTKTYTQVSGGGCNAHAALGGDPTRQRLLTFGGWSTNCPLRA